MKIYRYITMAAMLAAAVSCSKTIGTDSASSIKFSAGIETKAFLTSDDINVAGTQMAIYGYENSTAIINGYESTYDAAKGWVLDKDYPWSNGKDYAFFSYLTKDSVGNDNPVDLDMSGRMLTHPVRAFDFAEGDNNFDFCYSDVVYRPSDKPDHSVVNLNLKHLYTAIAFSAHNYTDKTITVQEVSLVGLKNKKSASINFADTGTKVTYNNASCYWTDGFRKLNEKGSIILNRGDECANIVGEASTTPQYYMFWPQTSGELAAGGWTDSGQTPSGGAYIKVVYKQGGGDITRYAQFPQEKGGIGGWPAGTKRMMQIAFRDDYFTIEVKALPWDYSEPTIKYDDEVTVAENGTLHFDSATCTVDEVSRKVYFKGAYPITGSFKLSSPSEGTWSISKEGDYDAFEIDDTASGRYGDGEDRSYGSVDIVAGNSFTLYPKDVASGRDYSIQLSFSIRYPNGESYCIDDKIQSGAESGSVNKWTIIFTR